MNFRYDINGLRAIAVLAVVIFHFSPQWLPGGFAGVDVFFVISGFLMTSIIFSGVEKNTFNLFKFYNARANRIVPVLAAVSAVLLVFGWFYLLPTDYRDLGKQVEKSSLFISNLLFAKGGGYFDTAEHTKWLLHTWSLSVEWQFYIFFPVIIIALKKYLSFSNLKRVVIGLFLASFIYCIYATYKDSKTAYFLLTSRAWEMLLGGLAFLYPWSLKSKLHQIVTQCLGIAFIIASYFLISKDTPWPGYMALIPVFGAYLIVVSNFQSNVILNNPLMSNIGKWSYSIYVWHWPLVVFGFYFAFENWWIYGIPLSILLGFLSYQFIEKINFPRYSSWKEIYKVKPFYIFLIIVACGYVIKENNGFNQRFSEIDMGKFKNTHYCHVYSEESKNTVAAQHFNCKLGLQDSKSIGLLWGDSYAGHLDPFIINFLNEKQSFVSRTASHCVPSTSYTMALGSFPEYCQSMRKKTLQEIKSKKYKVIFLAGRWEYMYTEDGDKGFNAVMEAINIASKNSEIVYFVAQPIYYQKPVKDTYLRSKISTLYPSKLIKNDELPLKMNLKFEKAIIDNNYKNVYLISRDVLYGSTSHSDFTSLRVPYTYDQGHLSDIGSIEMSNNFMKSEIFKPLKSKFPELIKDSF